MDRAVVGIPAGKILEIYGKESSFKTTTALRIASEVNKVNYETGQLDVHHEDPCGVCFIDLEQSFEENWARNLGFDASLEVNDIDRVTGGDTVGDLVANYIREDLYSLIIIDSLEGMFPVTVLEGDMDTNEMGLRAKTIYKAVRKWLPALGESAARNIDTPWRVPTIIGLNHMQEKPMTMYPEFTTPGGNAFKFYSSMRIQMSKIRIQNDTKKDFGRGSVKGTIVKNKITGAAGRIFEYEMALKDLDDLAVGEIDNVKSVFKDAKDFGLLEKTDNGYSLMGEEFRVQKDITQKMYAEPEYLKRVWDKMIEVVNG